MKKVPFEKRRQDARRVMDKYPDKIPVIIEKDPNSDIPDLKKHKFIMGKDMKVGHVLCMIRKSIEITEEQGIFLFVKDLEGAWQIPAQSAELRDIYKEHATECGYIIFMYAVENTFGN